MSEFHTGQWWADTLALLGVDFVQQSILAALLLGVLSGAIAPIIVMRNMSFAAHSTGELALMGAAAALLFGFSVSWGALLGAVCAAVVLGVVGAREQDSIVAVVLSFGMGLSVLFIYLYPGRSSTAFSLLTGQIVGVSSSNMKMLAVMTVIVVAVIALLWRPLLFATVDPTLAAASGVKVRLLSVLFAALLGAVASQGVQIVGALLLIALLITPGAAAVKVTANPLVAVVLSAVFSVTAAVGRAGALAGTRSAGLRFRDDVELPDLPGLLVHRVAAGSPDGRRRGARRFLCRGSGLKRGRRPGRPVGHGGP